MANTPTRRLAGQSYETADKTNRRLAGDNVVPINREVSISQLGPLAAPAVAATLMHRGLRVRSARKRNLYDNRPSIIGMRTLFSVDFYDGTTKQAVSPTSVKIDLITPSGGTFGTINLTENTGRAGHYDGSFLPTIPGEWIARLKYGTAGEVVDKTQFYVLPAS
jgi:hypothetical protein